MRSKEQVKQEAVRKPQPSGRWVQVWDVLSAQSRARLAVIAGAVRQAGR